MAYIDCIASGHADNCCLRGAVCGYIVSVGFDQMKGHSVHAYQQLVVQRFLVGRRYSLSHDQHKTDFEASIVPFSEIGTDLYFLDFRDDHRV